MRVPARFPLRRHGRLRAGIPGQIAVTATLGILVLFAAGCIARLPGNRLHWLVAGAVYLLGCILLARLMHRHYRHDRLGGGNRVTLLRAALVCALLPPLLVGQPSGSAVAAVGGLALALDGVDGWLARRSGLASDFGGRFDIEVDSALALVLSLHALSGTGVGIEVLFLGLLRYGFVIAGRVLPWLRAPLPPRRRRKLICVLQLSVLVMLQLPVLPLDVAIWAIRITAVLLSWSFATDIRWLSLRRKEHKAVQEG